MSPRVVIEADGGSRGNPGPAGFGAVVRDADSGEVLAERSGGLGSATNNVAEYQGLLAGLEAAVELGATDAEIRLDSKLVVEQMSGRWRVKHAALQPLALAAGRLVRSLDSARFQWVPRERNKHADRLANEAMDEQAGIGDRTSGDGDSGDGNAGGDAVRADRTDRASAPAGSGKASVSDARTEQSATPRPWTGAVGEPTRLLILRHGQTEMSVDRRYSGRGDVPLTELGEQQARAAAKRLAAMDGVVGDAGPAPVVSSPLLRTHRTAQLVAEATGAEVRFDDGLVETDFGSWEGLTFGEAAEQYAEEHRAWLGDPTVAPPHGESLQAVHERVRATCDELVERHAGRTVVLVTHVTPIKSLLRIGLDAGPSLFYRLHLDLASLSVVEFYPDGNASVRLVNDTSHLG